MNIEAIMVGEFQVNCFVLWVKRPMAVVIDPGADPAAIRGLLRDKGLTPAVYLLTHGHYDHVSALNELCTAMPAPTGLHLADLEWTFTDINQMPPFYNSPGKRPSSIFKLDDGISRTYAGMTFCIIHTPGHTPGSVCIYFKESGALFTGDTLFSGSVGRTDLPGGSSRDLQSSLARLTSMPEETKVFPGHGPDTTIQKEKATNFFMRSKSPFD